MPTGEPDETPTTQRRQARRKAETRQRILGTAQRLFAERGYSETSIEDIAATADVAIRTIYLHFPSKAAIMLAYFDGWLDAFVDAVQRRPVDEPVADSVRFALSAMAEAGWADRTADEIHLAYPFLDQMTSGALDIAGHVLQRWLVAMDALAATTAARTDVPAGSLVPSARASAVFAAWLANMAVVQATRHGMQLPEGATGNSTGLEILGLITGGEL